MGFTFDPLWFNIICWDMRAFVLDMAPFMKGRMLDVGCGSKQPVFSPDRYIGMDVPCRKSAADIYGSALRLPFKSGQFDSVACLSVLEHLPEPQQALDEIFRVLKQDGVCAFIVPFINRMHMAPDDYFRFTRHGIEYMLVKAGFSIMRIKDGGGMWKTAGARFAGYLYSDVAGMGYAGHDLRGTRKPWLLPLVFPLIVITVILARLLDKLQYIDKDTAHYYILCSKSR